MAVIFNGAVPAAGTSTITCDQFSSRTKKYATMQSRLVYGAGGTTIKAYLQTTYDDGATWQDVICNALALASARLMGAAVGEVSAGATITGSDGALADNTVQNGLLSAKYRVKLVVAGTYTGSTLRIDVDLQDSSGR